MADKIIQMQVRNASNTAWDNIYPVTKDNVPYAIATGSTNVYATTITPALSSYVEGMALSVKIPVDSTGACTINVNGLGAVGIKKANGADVTNLKAGGIYTLRYDGVNFILQGEGASGNATASDLLSGKTATTDAGEITGTMIDRGAISQSLAINGTYTILEGYHNGSGKVTQSIPVKSAQTYTPTTTNQVISAGQYLSGSQTILGDSNLVGPNILAGKSIFGVAGTGGSVVVQSGVSVLTGGANAIGSAIVNISAVDLSKSIVLAQLNGENVSLQASVSARFVSSSQLEFKCAINPSYRGYVAWSVITFSNAVVQSGTTTISVAGPGQSHTQAISTVNLNKSFALAYNYLTSSGTYKTSAYLSSPSGITIRLDPVSYSSLSYTVDWFVVEFN